MAQALPHPVVALLERLKIGLAELMEKPGKLLWLLFYKLIEDAALGFANKHISADTSRAMRYVVENLPWFSSMLIALFIGYLLLHRSKSNAITSAKQAPKGMTDGSAWIQHFDELFTVDINTITFRGLWKEDRSAGTQPNPDPFLVFNFVVKNNTTISVDIIGCKGQATIDGDLCTFQAKSENSTRYRSQLEPWRQTTINITQPLQSERGRELIEKVATKQPIRFSCTSIRLLLEHSDGRTSMPPKAIGAGCDVDPTGITLENSVVTRRQQIFRKP